MIVKDNKLYLTVKDIKDINSKLYPRSDTHVTMYYRHLLKYAKRYRFKYIVTYGNRIDNNKPFRMNRSLIHFEVNEIINLFSTYGSRTTAEYLSRTINVIHKLKDMYKEFIKE